MTTAVKEEKIMMTADEVAEELGISKAYAYKVMQQLNRELRELGYITISGKVSTTYFRKKFCYGADDGKED